MYMCNATLTSRASRTKPRLEPVGQRMNGEGPPASIRLLRASNAEGKPEANPKTPAMEEAGQGISLAPLSYPVVRVAGDVSWLLA
jgi:hypothetical protein